MTLNDGLWWRSGFNSLKLMVKTSSSLISGHGATSAVRIACVGTAADRQHHREADREYDRPSQHVAPSRPVLRTATTDHLVRQVGTKSGLGARMVGLRRRLRSSVRAAPLGGRPRRPPSP